MARRKSKRRLTDQQEFDIMKLVLDKFLWLGFIIMAWGMYMGLTTGTLQAGLWYLVAGAILLLLFVVIIVKEFEVLR